MKREELKRIVEYRLFQFKRETHNLKNLTREFKNGEEITLDESEWFLKYEELSEEFEVLKKEVKAFLKMDDEVREFYRNYKCSHNILIGDFHCVFRHYQERCVLCGETTFYNHKYKHEKNDFAMFLGEEIIDYYEDEFKTNYTEIEILNIILNICNNSNSDEIDIVKEIKRLKYEKCDIVRNKDKIFVMIVIGSNKEYIDKYCYFDNTNNIEYKSLINSFRELLNVHVTIVGNKEELKEYKSDDSIELLEYESITDLEKNIKYYSDKYDYIFDMSNLYKFNINNNLLNVERYKCDFSCLFPSSKVVRINDLSKESKDKIINSINKDNREYYYGNYYNFYCYEDGEVKGFSESEFIDETKKMLLNKAKI